MKNRNVKVIDEHNIDRDASVMFALDLEGSEYVVYWIERDEESNNVFVSKVLRNLDGTYNMLNIDDADKKKDVADIVKMLITNAVSDQNDKMLGTTTTLSNGKVIKFTDVSFNKEQNINVSKTYITTVKKEVTKVAESYYDVIVEETKVADVLPAVTPVVEPVSEIFPEANTPAISSPVVETPVVSTPVEVAPASVPTDDFVAFGTEPVIKPDVQSTPVETPLASPVIEPIILETPIVEPTSTVVEPTPVSIPEPVVAPVQEEVKVIPPAAEPTPVIPTPVVATPVAEPVVQQPVAAPEVSQTLVFNATNETNLNAALGEVANSATIPVENIEPVREFGVDAPVAESVVQQPVAAPAQETPATSEPQTLVTQKAGFANSKFFMVVAVAFFLASCIFLGYEVYNYFQLVK